MSKWFPAIYDLAMNPLENGPFNKIRRDLLQQSKGRVLEIGSGTGINFPLYKDLAQVDAVEPNPIMIEKSKARDRSVPIKIHNQTAEKMSFEASTFDTVIATLVFCTIPNPPEALKEIQRVSKPGASILFFEHVKMKQPFLARLQELLTPFWKSLYDGCHLNRDTLKLITESGLEVKSVKSYYKGLFLVIECVNQKID